MTKTHEENWIDWEGFVFGFGYGTGEPYTIPALKRFLELTPERGCYDHRALERELGPVVAWLMINALARHPVNILEYGMSPRFAWLTNEGRALKRYVTMKTANELITLVCEHDEDYTQCYPDVCNCGPNGYERGRACVNPFWVARPSNA